MERRIKKATVIGIITFFTICILVGTMHIFFRKDQEELSSNEKALKIVTETYPTQIIVYGDKINFDSAISVKYIDVVNKETLTRESKYSYSLIIVNDLTGNATLSDDDWSLLSDLVKSDNTYNLFYLGDEDIDQILRVGVVSDLDMWNEGDLSIGLTHEGADIITVFGTYYKDAGFLLPEAIIAEQVFSIKMSN